MHNLKELRKNLDKIKIEFKNRNVDFDVNNFNKKDTLNRDLINKKEKLEQEKNFYQNQKKNQISKNQKKFLKKYRILKKNKA